MGFKTIIPEHGELEHVITEELNEGRVLVACGHDHFKPSKLETRLYEESFGFISEETEERFCSSCVNRIRSLETRVERY